jgi:hypothetical protein
MKLISQTTAIERLGAIREEFRELVRESFEHRAVPCSICKTPGACCLDEHFVNVRISRLEAAAIAGVINSLEAGRRDAVFRRLDHAIEKYKLDDAIDPATTYACPLFERGTGCLVHTTAKPLPCIAHACYEKEHDLPPDDLLTEREAAIEKLDQRTYGKCGSLLPLPVAVRTEIRRIRHQP